MLGRLLIAPNVVIPKREVSQFDSEQFILGRFFSVGNYTFARKPAKKFNPFLCLVYKANDRKT